MGYCELVSKDEHMHANDYFFFFSSRRRHTRCSRDWSSDVCSSDLGGTERGGLVEAWLEDPGGPEPVLGFWVRVAAGPILEAARAAIATPSRDDWTRSEERRVGKECRSRWSPYPLKKK